MAKKSTGNRTATGVAALAHLYYDKAVIANLKTNSPFMHMTWDCACGGPNTHEEAVIKNGSGHKIYLCDGCHFRFTVMKAAGRVDEFVRAYDKQRDAREKEPIDILKRKPLPAKTGKTIQMYNYKPVGKP